MSKYTYIIDAGHGGVDANGHYTTDPKKNKKYTFPDGYTILEGVINRKIAALVESALKAKGIDFAVAYNTVTDLALSDRVRLANLIHSKKPSIYISIHSNSGKGRGFEIFTSKGNTKSDAIAEVFIRHCKNQFPGFPFRADKSDGDFDKEENFYVLEKTNCPAILTENLFFDERSQANFLDSEEGQKQIAQYHIDAIFEIEGI